MSAELLRTLLFSYADRHIERVRSSGSRFAYYTTAHTALQILMNREIWMRSTRTMNDSSEIQHGIDCVLSAVSSDTGKRLEQAIDQIAPGAFGEVANSFRAWIPGFQEDTFVTCLSEHNSTDDQFGRLSMWRAYGGKAGVALVFRPEVLLDGPQNIAAYSSPVAYVGAEDVSTQLGVVADDVARHRELLLAVEKEEIKTLLFNMLRFATICTKHPSFREEQEWRVVSSPTIEDSTFLRKGVENIGDIPQVVLKLPLVDSPERGVYGLNIANILDRVLIGPTEYPTVLWRAFSTALDSHGIENAHQRVTVTNVPLRDVRK